MVHKHLAIMAGCAAALVLLMGGGAAWAKDIRLASLATTTATSALSPEAGQVRASALDFGTGQASEAGGRAEGQGATDDRSLDAPKTSHKKAAAKPAKHKACVHGEWVSPEEFNPFTLSCTEVGF